MESMVWSTMMVSMTLAGSPRGWAHWTGRLPEPAQEGVDPEDVEVHGEPTI